MSETSTETTTEAPAESTYAPPPTQADLDRIIAERVNRTKAQFKDYGDLKAKAEQFDQLQQAQKTEAQRAADAVAAAEKKAAEVTASLRAKTAENALLNVASGKLRVPSDAVLHLASQVDVGDDGSVDVNQISTLIDDLLARRPDLAGSTSQSVPKPNYMQGTGGTPAPNDARTEFAHLFNSAIGR